jgi:hypothetical protein
MKKSNKFQIGILLIGLGLILIGIIMGARYSSFVDYLKGTNNFQHETYTSEQIALNIDINLGLTSENRNLEIISDPELIDTFRVEYAYETDKDDFTFTFENETFYIKLNSKKNWLDYVGVFTRFLLPEDLKRITLYVPENISFNSVKAKLVDQSITIQNQNISSLVIENSTGNVNLKSVNTDSLNIKCSSGLIRITDNISNTAVIKGNNGDFYLENITANDYDIKGDNGKLSIKNFNGNKLVANFSNGSITLEGVNLTNSGDIRSSNGIVELTNCQISDLNVKANNGKINLTDTISQVLKVKADNGNINYKVTDKALLNVILQSSYIKLSTDNGNNTILGKKVEKKYVQNATISNQSMTIETDNGNINITTD